MLMIWLMPLRFPKQRMIDDVDNSADQGADDASNVEDTTDADAEDKVDSDDELDSDSVVPESKPAVNVSQPIAVVKRS